MIMRQQQQQQEEQEQEQQQQQRQRHQHQHGQGQGREQGQFDWLLLMGLDFMQRVFARAGHAAGGDVPGRGGWVEHLEGVGRAGQRQLGGAVGEQALGGMEGGPAAGRLGGRAMAALLGAWLALFLLFFALILHQLNEQLATASTHAEQQQLVV